LQNKPKINIRTHPHPNSVNSSRCSHPLYNSQTTHKNSNHTRLPDASRRPHQRKTLTCVPSGPDSALAATRPSRAKLTSKSSPKTTQPACLVFHPRPRPDER
jgi:hypothetical protein